MRRSDESIQPLGLVVAKARATLRRGLRVALIASSALSLVAGPQAALAADPGYLPADYGAASSGGDAISLGIGKSYVVTLPRDAKEVFVADPAIANAVVRSARKAYLIGAAPGQTDVKFIDADGREIASYEVSVSRDVGSIRSSIGRSINGSSVRVEGVGDNIVVTGSVKSAQEAQTAIDIAGGYMADPKKVVNALKIEGQDQVMLKVKIVEMQREVLKQLGVDYNLDNFSVGKVVLDGLTDFPFSASGMSPSSSAALGGAYAKGSGSAAARISALERNGVARTLAEPTLTAISGENAKFLVGGEFPVITGVDTTTGTASVSFKQFGVGLNFTPVVLSGGRISLRLSTEVSEIDTSASVTLGNTSIPGLKTRRADSTVEIPSGGSLVMAGLIQQQTKRALNGLPGLMKLPVLGQLFRSNDYQRNETELAIFVTPYIAKAVAPQKLASPDDGFAEPTDQSNLLFGRLNRIYGLPARAEPTIVSKSQGGFILD